LIPHAAWTVSPGFPSATSDGGDGHRARNTGDPEVRLEGRKQIRHGRTNLLVRIEDRLALVVDDVAHRQGEPQPAARGSGTLQCLKPTGEDVQLGLGHRPLDAAHQAIVDVP